jgi:plasmid stability protein
MTRIVIRNLDAKTMQSLGDRAAQSGRSLEEEARHILLRALSTSATSELGLGSDIAARFKALGGVEIPTAIRQRLRPVRFK